MKENPPTPILKALLKGMQGHALSHGSSAIQITKFSFQILFSVCRHELI